ncbi:ubiquitin carboxyl-terminal hydrolase 37-like isoform X2 [Xyrichtys novacula]|uniref:Ubiquitin carboxyl-terminal hydrolase 37-like isoform X2 n=1 Tax=Xyrichtys novacula TaxID=13765 RepID=A0AAV1FLV3_XYRNO|nr:ubiquitin carboxyl-terminal hydrolase 37-like isoform X2 [Xyrichtys novacula]
METKIQPTPVSGEAPRIAGSSFNTSDTAPEASSAENRCPKYFWLHRLFGQPVRKVRSPISQQRRDVTPNGLAGSTAPPPGQKIKKPKEKKWGCSWFLKCCSREKRESPLSDPKGQQKPPKELQRSIDEVSQSSVPQSEPTVACQQINLSTEEVSQRRVPQSEPRFTCQQVNLGFPNPAQICYMNSSLQSLLTLTRFVRDIRSQEEVWSLIPEAQLMSYFMDIVRLRDVGDMRRKLEALYKFKRLLSIEAPEFVDHHQKDAHEFLTAVLGQMRDLAAPLRQVASILGRYYRCPVEQNLVFRMQNTRKCKSCGSASVREEEFLNLSLDLIPGGSVQQMLQEYEKATDVDFSCECGGKTSAQCSTFTTLPNFLVLQIKRFRFTESYELVKQHDPVDLTRELIMTSSQDTTSVAGCTLMWLLRLPVIFG